MSCYVMLDGVFLFMTQRSATESIRIKKILEILKMIV
jgi:hypothetical protein